MELISPIFARITKVDEVTRTVTGRATQEMVDRDREVFDYESSKPNFQAWSASVHADTGGKSLGNVRAMHGSVAAGILTDIDFNDAEKAIDVQAHITDDQEWKKVLTGTYSGFSIGGKYTKKWSDTVNGQIIRRYTADPAEISIVDRPCVPAAKFFTVHKADGSEAQVAFAPALMQPTEGSGTDAANAGLGFYARIKLEKQDGSELAKGDDQPRDDHGRFGSGGDDTASAAKEATAASANAREKAIGSPGTGKGFTGASKRADVASRKAEKAGTAQAHTDALVAHTTAAAAAGYDFRAQPARTAHMEAAAAHGRVLSSMKTNKADGADLDDEDDVVKAAPGTKGAGEAAQASATEATGAALGASNEAFSSNDVDLHENAAAAHAKAATEQLALGNSNLASHHINAAKGHLDWQASKSPVKVPAQSAQGKQRVVH